MNEKVKSSIYGFIIGDILGVPVEFYDREFLKENPVKDMMINKQRGTTIGFYSDDTAMTLCTMEGITENPNIFDNRLHKSIIDKYILWVKDGYKAVNNRCFGIGGTTISSLNSYRKSKSIEEYCNKNIESDKKGGNGALMRILPLVLYLYNKNMTKKEKIDIIIFNSKLTHNNCASISSCIFYTLFIFNLLDTNNLNESYNLSVKEFNNYCEKDIPHKFDRILSKKLLKLKEEEINSTGFVIDTLESSLWCLFTTTNYKDSILKAINLGNDTDTIAAITGSLSGLYYGINEIPKKWLNNICEKEMIDNMINEYLKILN